MAHICIFYVLPTKLAAVVSNLETFQSSSEKRKDIYCSDDSGLETR